MGAVGWVSRLVPALRPCRVNVGRSLTVAAHGFGCSTDTRGRAVTLTPPVGPGGAAPIVAAPPHVLLGGPLDSVLHLLGRQCPANTLRNGGAKLNSVKAPKSIPIAVQSTACNMIDVAPSSAPTK
jgi:hypothetical protein